MSEGVGPAKGQRVRKWSQKHPPPNSPGVEAVVFLCETLWLVAGEGPSLRKHEGLES